MVSAKESAMCGRAMRRAREHREKMRAAGDPGRPRRVGVGRAGRAEVCAERIRWRRLTSLTLELEPFMDDLERREGLKRLVKWMQEAIAARRKIHGGQGAQGAGGEESAASESAARKRFGMLGSWGPDVEAWARVQSDGLSIEALCAHLGITRSKLTQLTQEFCNLTAAELVDGFKLRGLKGFVIARLREAANQLWGPPGYFATWKCDGFLDCEGRRTSPPAPLLGGEGRRDFGEGEGRSAGMKQSRFFRTRMEDVFGEPLYVERARRINELLARMGRDVDLQSWAVAAGFSSGRG